MSDLPMERSPLMAMKKDIAGLSGTRTVERVRGGERVCRSASKAGTASGQDDGGRTSFAYEMRPELDGVSSSEGSSDDDEADSEASEGEQDGQHRANVLRAELDPRRHLVGRGHSYSVSHHTRSLSSADAAARRCGDQVFWRWSMASSPRLDLFFQHGPSDVTEGGALTLFYEGNQRASCCLVWSR